MPLPAFTLIVELGDGQNLAANAYATVAEADAVLAMNNYAVTWFDVTDPDKQRYLARATQMLDANMRWNGSKLYTNQPLQWPRQWVRDPDVISYGYWRPVLLSSDVYGYYSFNTIPGILKQATAEVAFRLTTADVTQDADNKGINSIGVGSGAVSIQFNQKHIRKVFNDTIEMLLSRLGTPRYRGGVVSAGR